MTHSESPWTDTADNPTISDKSMKDCYSKLAFANNFPLDLAKKPFYPVLTDNHYAFVFDMNEKDAASAQVYPSYKVYKAKQKAASEELKKLLMSLERK